MRKTNVRQFKKREEKPEQEAEQKPVLSVGQLWNFCIEDAQHTRLVKAGEGDYEVGGVRGGDIMIINTQTKPRKGSVAVIREDGELHIEVMDAPMHLRLVGAKPKAPTFEVYGVVERIIRHVQDLAPKG